MNRLSIGSVAKENFDSARLRLSESLSELEETVKLRIEQEVAESRAIASEGEFDLESKLSDLKLLNSKLNRELKIVQKNLAEVGKENLFLHEKTKFLSSRIANFKEQSLHISEQIETKINQIEELIKSDDH